MGCLYFDQKHFSGARGYGYVGVSRFRLRGGCYLYGHKRRTDFLPVGGNPDEEVLERGDESESEDNEHDLPEYAFEGNSIFQCMVDLPEEFLAKDTVGDFQ